MSFKAIWHIWNRKTLQFSWSYDLKQIRTQQTVVDAGDSTRLSQLCQMGGALALLVVFDSSGIRFSATSYGVNRD
jgi:hypothetical protein